MRLANGIPLLGGETRTVVTHRDIDGSIVAIMVITGVALGADLDHDSCRPGGPGVTYQFVNRSGQLLFVGEGPEFTGRCYHFDVIASGRCTPHHPADIDRSE